jgi:histidyl-tRNA synthetase
MYTFPEKRGPSLALRPEGPAGVVRAALEHVLHAGQPPVKLWYAGPMVRDERPQAGRFRQFQQVGVEALGLDDPALDAEVVTLAVRVFDELGVTRVRLLLNSIGDGACRPVFHPRRCGISCATSTSTRTPGHGSSSTRCASSTTSAPRSGHRWLPFRCSPSRLCADCKAHYDAVRGYLTDLGVTCTEASTLTRGLDPDIRDGRVDVSQAVDQPVDGAIGPPRRTTPAPRSHDRDVGQAVSVQRDRDPQVAGTTSPAGS